jgi:hypothetical protein
MEVVAIVGNTGLACNIRVYKSPFLETSFDEKRRNNGAVTAGEYRSPGLCKEPTPLISRRLTP